MTSPLRISPVRSTLRTDYFRTLPRDVTRSFSVGYTNTAPDPRIGAKALDLFDAQRHAFGCEWHYLILTDGRVEVGRHPRTRSTRLRHKYEAIHEALNVGVVGGLDPETGRRIQSTTPAQEEALEALMQKIVDVLGVPLEVHDGRENWTRREEADAKREAEEDKREAAMDRAEALFA